MRTNLLFVLSLIAAIFSGCNRNDNFVAENSCVTLRAMHDVSTRVTFDGAKSTWNDGDYLNVVVDGLEDIYTFNYNADSECDFVCNNLTLPAEQNDVVAFYGTDAAEIDVTSKTASVYLGATHQEQSAELPMAHIAKYDILYGKALQAAKDDIQIAMEHSIAAIKVNIMNSLAEAKTIKSVTITVPEGVALAGDYIINPLMEEISLADDTDVCNSVMVTFGEAVTLETEADITSWIAAAPFALEAGDEMTIDIITSDDEIYRCMKTIPEGGVTFDAGSIMSTTIKLGGEAKLVEPDTPSEITIVVDPTVDGVMPSDFPDDAKDNVKEGDFVLAGYTFSFESPVPFYISSNKRIRFDKGITKTSVAMIKLPIIEDYKLTSVTLAAIKDHNKRNYMFAITDAQGVEIKGGDAYKLSGDKHLYSLEETELDTSYYICISNTASSGNTNPADLAYISLTYSK